VDIFLTLSGPLRTSTAEPVLAEGFLRRSTGCKLSTRVAQSSDGRWGAEGVWKESERTNPSVDKGASTKGVAMLMLFAGVMLAMLVGGLIVYNKSA